MDLNGLYGSLIFALGTHGDSFGPIFERTGYKALFGVGQ
jgi:hypothetical protein